MPKPGLLSIGSVVFSDLKTADDIADSAYEVTKYSLMPIDYFNNSVPDAVEMHWARYCSDGQSESDIDAWQSRVLDCSSQYFSACDGYAQQDELLKVLDFLSDYYPLGRKSKLIDDIKKYLPEIISSNAMLRESSVLKSLFGLVFYSPHLPALHSRIYYDEASGCLGLNFKRQGSVMNMTVKGSGEFVYSIALKGKSVATFSGRAVIRNNKDSGKINKIFGMLYGDECLGKYY